MSGHGGAEAVPVAAAEEKIVNVAKNVVLPVNPNREKMISGTATHIAAEVIVSKLLRQGHGNGTTRLDGARSYPHIIATVSRRFQFF